MNKNIKLAVAGAVLALSATANAGIIIPAGDWTLDVNGNVNTYATWNKSDVKTGDGGGAQGMATGPDVTGRERTQGINTGLLPTWLGFTGTTRQNDVDVSFTISMQPNVSDNGAAGDGKTPLFRQSFMTFGDKSWGSFKLGKDIGIFASDAILNDMTLLGVGAVSAGVNGASTTYGGIGTGYIYAAWKGQIAYTTPNMNGFQATVGITNPEQDFGLTSYKTTVNGDTDAQLSQKRHGLEGKASYSFSANDVTGKIWVSGASYKPTVGTQALSATSVTKTSYSAYAVDIGANVNVANFGLTGYYYKGDGAGTTTFGASGYSTTYGKRESDGGYVQATYVLPFKTKIGVAYGVSNLDKAGGEGAGSGATALTDSNERYTIGAYHPLTKHLNLVAEWNQIESKAHNGGKAENNSGSLGAILFF
jgi:predicted porin